MEHFWRLVCQRPNVFDYSLPFITTHCFAEVPNLYCILMAFKEDIARFQISMSDAMGVQIFNSRQNLDQELLNTANR